MHLMSDGAMNLDALTVVGNFNEGLKAESDETMNISKSHFDNNGWVNTSIRIAEMDTVPTCSASLI
jgi:hypothetical protein